MNAKEKAKHIIEHELYCYFIINEDGFDEYNCRQVAFMFVNSIIQELEAHIKHKGLVIWEKERINYWKKVQIEIINYEF